MLRAVLDTNVLVNAIISEGKPRDLLRKGSRKSTALYLQSDSERAEHCPPKAKNQNG